MTHQPEECVKNKPVFRQETRLGLVLYGGVALAIYMNGVCREFYNAVRGRGIYKLIKALTDSDIIVDILSGTSAGGINGVLLSYALANSTKNQVIDFKQFATLWRDGGSILNLLHQPNPSNPTNIESVLDGDRYYQEKLEAAFKTQPKEVAADDEWFSESSELDLFVTGTDVLGRVYKAFDNTGRAIEIKDHRCVFLLKHREERKEPFNSNLGSGALNNYKALATLCRITSCFPAAFPPVSVSLETENDFNQKLVEWGKLDNRELPKKQPPDGYQLHFVDGGILDNRPFSYTIKEMYYRTAYRPVERKLFYIDPSPDRLLDSPTFKLMAKPNIGQVIIESLVGLPRYESIGSDLELIKEFSSPTFLEFLSKIRLINTAESLLQVHLINYL